MGLRIRFQYPSGGSLGYSIERLADGAILDTVDGVFRAQPATPIASLPEDTGLFLGRYRTTLTSTPKSQFLDGDYAITIHNLVVGLIVGELAVVFRSGDDSSIVSTGLTSDPWATPLTGAYAAGTAGAILLGNLDTKVSTRSTYAGGAVASVTAAVTVGQNNDKSGYVLSPSGLDLIQVEPGINARQSLSPILAASAGVVSGAGTGTIVIRGANVATSRIIASTDNAGNRSAVSLALPS